MSDDKTERINRIKELAQEMVLYSNPAEIEKTAKLIKKNVSLFSRANFCAYLFLKLNSNGGTGKVAEKKGLVWTGQKRLFFLGKRGGT